MNIIDEIIQINEQNKNDQNLYESGIKDLKSRFKNYFDKIQDEKDKNESSDKKR